MFNFIVIFTVIFLLNGCSSSSNEQEYVQCPIIGGEPRCPNIKEEKSQEDYEIIQDASQRGLNYENGSLYSEQSMFSLYADKRAYRVGDILTVVLSERTQSSKSAGSSLDKSTGIDLGVPVAGALNVSELNLGVGSSTEFDGSSTASQQNFLSGAITVRVTHVLSNDTLVIRGRKRIQLNQGDEYIEIEGLVRPSDIDVANRISSLRIADAEISYTGKGTFADASSPGWFTSFFSRYLNPF